MAFTDFNFTCISSSLNEGQLTITPFSVSPPGVATLYNAPNVFVYGTSTDTVATILGANYFLPKNAILEVNDIILGNGSDASFAVKVTAATPTSVTVVSMGLTTAIGTANIVDGAVTTPKLANNAVDSSKLALNTLQYAAVPISSAEFQGMFAAPKLLIAAPGVNQLIVVERAALAMTFAGAALTAGGVVAFQYDSTINGGGVKASNTEVAADFTGAAASTTFAFLGNTTVMPFTTTVNKGLYLSNATAAFATGTSTFVAHIWYKIIPTV